MQYGTPTATGGAPTVTIACSPQSGSLFPVGTTSVVCTVTDSRQRTNSCNFSVVVQQAPRLTVTRFVAFGDSVTWGENGALAAFDIGNVFRPRFQVPRTYPTVLYQLLAARYIGQPILVSNQGAPGEHARDSETFARFSNIVRSGGFDVVLLMEGSNDLSDGFAAAAVNGLRNMVREAKSRGVKPFIATIPPMDGSLCCPRRGSAAPLVPGFNDQIRGIAAAEGIPLVDVYEALNTAPRDYLSTDGLHPNEAGYEKIGQTFFNAVKSNLERATPPSTTTFGVPRVVSPYSPPRRRR